MAIRRLRAAVGRVLRARLRVPPYAAVRWQVIDPGIGSSWSGRTAVVTGAAGLLGRAVVAALVERGATVHAIDIDDEGLASLIGRHGDRVTTHAADLTDPAAATLVAAQVATHSPALHALVHCIGDNDRPATDQTITADQWHDVLAVNLVAPATTTDAFIPLLANAQASGVVFITSLNGRSPSKWPHYAAAKSGLSKLTEDLSLRLAPRGIRVNAVSPGWFTAVGPDSATPHHWLAPLGRAAMPVEAVVNAVLFLADPLLSPCTTGAELHVDAGGNGHAPR